MTEKLLFKCTNTSTGIRFTTPSHLFFPGVLVQIFLALVLAGGAYSQPMPPLKMQLPGNKVFDISEVPKGRPIILIYFDPDCDHCQKLMNEMFKKINQFKKAQLVFATFKPVNELDSVQKKYNVSKYPNVKMGTENVTYYLRLYYDVTTLPFTALYDKKGNLNYSYRKETSVDDLIARLRKIQ